MKKKKAGMICLHVMELARGERQGPVHMAQFADTHTNPQLRALDFLQDYCTGRHCFFFFSSRRRHTRLTCDWSSDVCSSDLPGTSSDSKPGLVMLDMGPR